MEPIRHTQTARLRSLKMYREELDKLVGMFQKSCDVVTISDNNNRYDTLDEMKAIVGPKIKSLDIRGQRPGLHFLLNQKAFAPDSPPAIFNELRTEEITDDADALFYKIREFLVMYQRPRFRRELIVPAIVSLIGVFWFMLHNHQVNKDGGWAIAASSLPAFWISVAVCFASIMVGSTAGNFLSLETKRNSASFFVRNREDFAKHAVTAAISVLIGGLVGWLIGHFLK